MANGQSSTGIPCLQGFMQGKRRLNLASHGGNPRVCGIFNEFFQDAAGNMNCRSRDLQVVSRDLESSEQRLGNE